MFAEVGHQILVTFQWILSADQILIRNSITQDNLYTIYNGIASNLLGLFIFYFAENLIQKVTPTRLIKKITNFFGIPLHEIDEHSNHKAKKIVKKARWPYPLIFILQIFPFSNLITPGVIGAVKLVNLRHGLLVIALAKITKVLLVTQFL